MCLQTELSIELYDAKYLVLICLKEHLVIKIYDDIVHGLQKKRKTLVYFTIDINKKNINNHENQTQHQQIYLTEWNYVANGLKVVNSRQGL